MDLKPTPEPSDDTSSWPSSPRHDTLPLPQADNTSSTPSPLSSSPGGAGTSTVAPEEAGDTPAVKQKRKRTRVTPEQLTQLEVFFAADRSPTAARRKEISDMLGMKERQTQVWFQNRRAKAKQQEGTKGSSKTKATSTEPQPAAEDSPSPQAPRLGQDTDLYEVLHEPDDIAIVPCSELTIGSWTRLASQVNKCDLIMYLCSAQARLSHYIHAAGCSVKMDIPFSTIVDMQLISATAESVQASFILSQPPMFYLEDSEISSDGKRTMKKWVRCADWTENMQASSVLRHDVSGPPAPLAYLWQTVSASRSSVASRRPSVASSSPTTASSPSLLTPPLPPPMHSREQSLSQGAGLDYMNPPRPPTNPIPFRRPYSSSVQDIRPIDTTSASRYPAPPQFTMPFPVNQHHMSPTIPSPTFSDVSGSLGDSPSMAYSPSSFGSGSPEFHRRGSLPPMLLRRSYSRSSLGQYQETHLPNQNSGDQQHQQFSRQLPAKVEAYDPTPFYHNLGGPSSNGNMSFLGWPTG